MVDVFKCCRINSTEINHIHNKSIDFIQIFYINFDMNKPLNLTEIVPAIGEEGMVLPSSDMQLLDSGQLSLNQACYHGQLMSFSTKTCTLS